MRPNISRPISQCELIYSIWLLSIDVRIFDQSIIFGPSGLAGLECPSMPRWKGPFLLYNMKALVHSLVYGQPRPVILQLNILDWFGESKLIYASKRGSPHALRSDWRRLPPIFAIFNKNRSRSSFRVAWSYPGTARLNLAQALKAAISYVVWFLAH